MNKVKVIVKDKTKLELLEDAKCGDCIDLADVMEIDTSYLTKLIENAQDVVYQEKVNALKNDLEKDYKLELLKEKEKLEKINESALSEEIKKYNDLKNEFDVLKANKIQQEQLLTLQLNSEFEKEKNNLNNKIKELENKLLSLENNKKIELENVTLQLKEEYSKLINDKERQIEQLQHTKSLVTKDIGEDLESWCDNEVLTYMQGGLQNCTWHKDNTAVKAEDEQRGTKADFIFKVYATKEHLPEQLLASVCLELKNESQNSKNKQKNKEFYSKLDTDRKKKNCKYALLVSNLEYDKENLPPIYKVSEYDDMYVVRPHYMMSFLTMIVSLTTRFSELILMKKKEGIELKEKQEIIDEFEKIKEKYLNKPLESLKASIETIQKQTETITKAARKIEDECYAITRKYVEQIAEKLHKFDVDIKKVAKKM